jgi:hypothetical protein
MHKIIKIFMCTTLLMAINSMCMGKVVEHDLNEMIDRSDVIVIGDITGVRETNDGMVYGYPVGSGVETVKIGELLKGNFDNKEIEVTYSLGNLSEDRAFHVCTQYLFFLRKLDNGEFSVVQGYAGSLHVRGNSVDAFNIRDVKNTVSLKDFLQKIRGVIKVKD